MTINLKSQLTASESTLILQLINNILNVLSHLIIVLHEDIKFLVLDVQLLKTQMFSLQ